MLVKFAVFSPAPMRENRGIVTLLVELFGSTTSSEADQRRIVREGDVQRQRDGGEMMKSVLMVIGTWIVWPGPIVVTV